MVNDASLGMTLVIFFPPALANFIWDSVGSEWEIIGLAQLWKLFTISMDWLEPESGPDHHDGGVVEVAGKVEISVG